MDEHDKKVQDAFDQAVLSVLVDANSPMTISEITVVLGRLYSSKPYRQPTLRAVEHTTISINKLVAEQKVVKINGAWSINPLDRLAMEAE